MERNFDFDPLKSRLNRDMDVKVIVDVCGNKMFAVDRCQFTSGPYHFSDPPLFLWVVCGLLRRQSQLLQLDSEESAYSREVGTMERQRNYMDPK